MNSLPTRRRSALLSASVFASLLLLMAGVVAAQSQLPGRQLTVDPANDLRPAWSPNGANIVFFSNRAGNYDIWMMTADGRDQHQLTTDESDDRRPAWSPDGQQVAFDSDRSGERKIWVMNADGSNQRMLTTGTTEDSFPAWSPDGQQLAFFAYDGRTMNLWVIEADGNNQRPVTSDLARADRNECTYACHMPEWSPNSQQIAFTGASQDRIWVIGVDGSNPQAISPGNGREHAPYWLADGRILYLSEHLNQTQETINDIWIMDADGQNAAMVFDNIPHGGPLIFQPNGQTITFHSPRSGNFDIYSITLGQAESTPQPMQVTLIPDLALSGPLAEAPTTVANGPAGPVDATPPPVVAAPSPNNTWMPWVAGGAAGLAALAGLAGAYALLQRRKR